MRLHKIGMLIVWVAVITNIFLALVLDISMAKYPWIHFIYWPICAFGMILMLKGLRDILKEGKEAEVRLNKMLEKGMDNFDKLRPD